MKLQTTRETLLAPLAKTLGAIEKRQTLPILGNVLLRRYGAGFLHLTGTDLEIQLITRAEVGEGQPGDITVQARKLFDVLRLLPERTEVTLDLRDDRLIVRGGSSRYSLQTLPAEQYPAFDLGNADTRLDLQASALRDALDKTAFAMAVQDVRYYLNGLLLEFDQYTLRAVASDGHRLAVHEEPGALTEPVEPVKPGEPRRLILPRKAVTELARLLKDADDQIAISISANTFSTDLGGLQFASKLIEGNYPHWQRVVPGDLDRHYTVQRGPFAAALERVKILSSDKNHAISLAVGEDQILSIRLRNADQEEAEETLLASVDGGPVEVGFNAAYLLEAVNHCASEHVRLSFNGHANSCLVEDPEDARFRFVVMPMRL
jgi:DNA polymerase-3 subunit beta